MLKKIKNNKGVAPAILGMMIIMFFIFIIAMSIDLFMATISRQELQTQVEMAQLYGLVKGVDVNKAREGELVVNPASAKAHFKQHFEEMTGGELIETVETDKGSKDFITIKQGVTDGYMFDDGIAREYIAAKSHIKYRPARYFRTDKPIEIKAATRIFIKNADEMGEDTGEVVN